MAKIVRYNGNLVPFASSSLGTERTLFGEVTQANDITSQFTADFLRGWGIVGPSDQPTLQDFNAVSYTHGQILAYLHQIGVAEYNATQEYHLGSVANSGGSLYVSRVNTNVGNTPASSPANWRNLDVAPGNVSVINAKANLGAANASMTITADEAVVKSGLGGTSYSLASISKVINLATTGAGGMDTGSAPASGYVAIYLIYNPTTGVSALLGSNATSVIAAEVYGGANMPSGYTASALVSVWPTTAGGLFVIGTQIGRWINRQAVVAINTNAPQAAFTLLSLVGSTPRNAKRVKVIMSTINGTVNTVQNIDLASDSSGSGQQSAVGGVVLASNGASSSCIVDILTAQTIYYRFANVGGGTPVFTINISGYEF